MRHLIAIAVILTVFASPNDAFATDRPKAPGALDLIAQIRANMPRYKENSLKRVKTTLEVKDNFASYGNLTASQIEFYKLQLMVQSGAVEDQISHSAEYQSNILHQVKDEFSLDSTKIHDVILGLAKDKILDPTPYMNIKPVYSPFEDPSVCPFPKCGKHDCNKTDKYRTIDGSCNNLLHPLWGRSDRPFRRMIPSAYADGLDALRTGVSGPLPSAREVSLKVSSGTSDPDPAHSFLFTIFAQFLDHDLTLTPIVALTVDDPMGKEESVHVTCGSDGCNTTGAENKACAPIPIPKDDVAFSSKKCIMFVRSASTPADECPIGPRQQTNGLTSFLDASNVYGSTKKTNTILRNGTAANRGALYMEDNPLGFRKLLQFGVDEDCRDVDNITRCFVAGDKRVNENVALTAIHTIFNRYHNDIEKKLYDLNPHWSGERLFQEARKILIAIWQHFIYNEFLPLLLGPKQMKKFGLKLKRKGYFDEYDPTLNPEIGNGFGVAAYRFGHSTLVSKFKVISPINDTVEEEVFLSQMLTRPSLVYRNYSSGASPIDSLMRGMYMQSMRKVDRHLTKEVTNKLFAENPPNATGLDLFALNIQRGRDHGVPGYPAWRKWCGLSVPTTIWKMKSLTKTDRKIFEKLYKNNADDVDLFAAGMSETIKKRSGSLVGPTFSCIIGRQFSDLRRADRFWFERNDPMTGFTAPQLKEIRKSLLSKVLCDVGDQVKTIQRYVMLLPGKSVSGYHRRHHNRVESCDKLPSINFDVWKETP